MVFILFFVESKNYPTAPKAENISAICFFDILAKLWRNIGNADSAGEDVGNALSVAELVNWLCVVRFVVIIYLLKLYSFRVANSK